MGYQSMINAVSSRLRSVVVTPSTIATEWPNSSGFKAPNPDPSVLTRWIKVDFDHQDTEWLCVGGYRQHATMVATVRVPVGRMDGEALAVGRQIQAAFMPQSVGGVTYKDPFITQAGRLGAWWAVSAVCPFYADDLTGEAESFGTITQTTPEAAHNAIRGRFKREMTTTLGQTVIYDNDPTPSPALGTPWVRARISFGGAGRSEIGSTGPLDGVGLVRAIIYSPVGQGVSAGLVLADQIVGKFRGAADSGVQFGVPSLRSIGRQSAWWRDDVRIPFSIKQAT